ncbi:MAG: hypothetical protein JNL01_14645 [Bdellovibrionales bacterium]|nr:hypothetical protein [Bdellovibrionales bacterium]
MKTNQQWFKIVAAAVAQAAIATSGMAATYNIIFNNTEQKGNGSVAKPSIAVDGNKVKAEGADETFQSSKETGKEDEEKLANGDESEAEIAESEEAESRSVRKKKWKSTGSDFGRFRIAGSYLLPEAGNGNYQGLSNGFVGSLGVYLSERLVLNAFYLPVENRHFGLEFEIAPVIVPGRNLPHIFELALLAGVNQLGFSQQNDRASYLSSRLSAHAGARATFYGSQHFGFTASYRRAVDTYFADVGVVLRF